MEILKKFVFRHPLMVGFGYQTKKKRLKKYLRKNYPEYFLADELIKEIQASAKRTDLPIYTHRKKVNRWLSEQGVASVGVLHNEMLLFKP